MTWLMLVLATLFVVAVWALVWMWRAHPESWNAEMSEDGRPWP